jgi:hypothetical protein
VTTYQLAIVTGRGPLESPPLHTETFDAPDDTAAVREAWKRTPELVGNPEEERGELYDGDGHVETISLARDEEDAR